MSKPELFDDWPERYEQWFQTPIGKAVKKVEFELVNGFLEPHPTEKLLDAGCGTGIFTEEFLDAGMVVMGIDLSAPMLQFARGKLGTRQFSPVQADMQHLPFVDESFDKTVSITALEFITDAQQAVNELFRVTKPGGIIVVATLNSLSPWAERRRRKTARGQKHVLENAYYRSGNDLLALCRVKGTAKTCVHFQKDSDPATALAIERKGEKVGLDTGAFVAVRWIKLPK